MKTYIELEQMGIVAAFKEDRKLYIITKGGDLWVYNSTLRTFDIYGDLQK